MRKMKDTKDLLETEEKELLRQFMNWLCEEGDCPDFNMPIKEKQKELLIENFGRYIR